MTPILRGYAISYHIQITEACKEWRKTCSTVMGVDQARMSMEHLEMKALIFHNADLIRQGII